ncbi:hypothetical protein [Jeotgalibacillus proteolyticus]|uniref:Uncharacterized protein n=1 Tax=Jeotgalibacillus proteolyticus TaxID=2082395 RepID=A0A2S5GFY5_9BACL|nr:hypothetical protein [Jeotgalibacillus proteolyticus]PPA71906.1 hypothetical protein C4B60_00575 [Jeotgalibacillus proteolyticus]
MKVSTEQAFDMLPHAADIYTKLNVRDYLQKNVFKPKKGESTSIAKKLAGADMIAYILKNLPKAKSDFFHIIAIFESKKVEEVKSQPLTQTMVSIKAIITDKDLMDFFKESV